MALSFYLVPKIYLHGYFYFDGEDTFSDTMTGSWINHFARIITFS